MVPVLGATVAVWQIAFGSARCGGRGGKADVKKH